MSTLDITRSVQRWEALGLLEGLPRWEKEEMAQLFDVVTKLLMYKTKEKVTHPEHIDMCENTLYPITRRLYRRTGTNFEVDNFVEVLIEKVIENFDELSKEPTVENNPIIGFCVEFSDTYKDEITEIDRFTDEQYEERVEKVINYVKEILLEKTIVSHVNRDTEDWEIKHSEGKKSDHQTRIWNQKVALTLLDTVLRDTNKGI